MAAYENIAAYTAAEDDPGDEMSRIRALATKHGVSRTTLSNRISGVT